MRTWVTLSVIALAPMLLRAPKALLPLRVSRDDPSRFAGLFRRYAIGTITGFASDVGKRSDSYTQGSIDSTLGADGHPASVRGSVQTEVVVTDRFFLTDVHGHVQSFEGADFDARVGDGHVVSLAWVIKGLKKSGPYFLIYNHTTGEAFFSDKAIRRALTFPFPAIYIALLFLMILPVPVLIFFALLELWQKFWFERSGVEPLIAQLQAQAPSPARRPEAPAEAGAAGSPDLAGALRELSALKESGALSDAEFAAAKAKVLRRGT